RGSSGCRTAVAAEPCAASHRGGRMGRAQGRADPARRTPRGGGWRYLWAGAGGGWAAGARGGPRPGIGNYGGPRRGTPARGGRFVGARRRWWGLGRLGVGG